MYTHSSHSSVFLKSLATIIWSKCSGYLQLQFYLMTVWLTNEVDSIRKCQIAALQKARLRQREDRTGVTSIWYHVNDVRRTLMLVIDTAYTWHSGVIIQITKHMHRTQQSKAPTHYLLSACLTVRQFCRLHMLWVCSQRVGYDQHVTPCQARLILSWVTVCGQIQHLSM